MKITIGKLISPATVEALNEFVKLELPAKVWYQTNTLIKKVNEELQKSREFRKSLIDKYAQKDEQGKPIINKPENPKSQEDFLSFQDDESKLKFAQATYDMLQTEIEFDFEQVDITALGNIKVKGELLLPLFGVLIKE